MVLGNENGIKCAIGSIGFGGSAALIATLYDKLQKEMDNQR